MDKRHIGGGASRRACPALASARNLSHIQGTGVAGSAWAHWTGRFDMKEHDLGLHLLALRKSTLALVMEIVTDTFTKSNILDS